MILLKVSACCNSLKQKSNIAYHIQYCFSFLGALFNALRIMTAVTYRMILNSVRRLAALPSSVALSATGCRLP